MAWLRGKFDALLIATMLLVATAPASAQTSNPVRAVRYPLHQQYDEAHRSSSKGLDAAWSAPEPSTAQRLPPVEELPPPVVRPVELPPVETAPSIPTLPAVPSEPAATCNPTPYFHGDFSADPIPYELPYDPHGEMQAYDGKHLNPTQRPWLEWGRPFLDKGPLPPSSTVLGETNLVAPQFVLFGDFRTAAATRDSGGTTVNQVAARLNLEADLKLTATERFHASMQPLNRNADFTRVQFDSNDIDFFDEFNANFVTGFFEGDLGSLFGGASGSMMPFDMPFAIGAMPLLFQNGVWLDDNLVGAAVTIPARNNPALDISNYDITFFTAFDSVNSPAFEGDNSAAKILGIASFIEVAGGYIEADYAYLNDRTSLDRSYHNLGLGFTRRYGRWLSNSVRVIGNVGQDPSGIADTADGALVLIENSLITENPYCFVPYCNFFAGFGRPQSVARNAAAGGILRNTGILFESDNLTGYPTLDATGNETWGGAFGVNLLPATLNHQLVAEVAFLELMDDAPFRPAQGAQQGMGLRYQRNLTHSWLLRADCMYGFLQNADDISGARVELRKKF